MTDYETTDLEEETIVINAVIDADEPRSDVAHVVEEALDAGLLVVLAVVGATFSALAAAIRAVLLVAEAALRIATGAPTPEDDPELAQIMSIRDRFRGAL